MAEPGFTLTTRWLVAASIEEVAAILSEPERLPEWWPAVYLAVDLLDPGDARGLGRTVAFHTRGWLPYTLRWQAPRHRGPPPARLDDRRDRRPRRPRGLDPRPAGRPRRHRLRLAHRGGKAAPEAADPGPQARLRRQPPLGDGPRPGGAAARARPPPRGQRHSAVTPLASPTGSDAGAGSAAIRASISGVGPRGRCRRAAPADRPRSPAAPRPPPAGSARSPPAAPPRRPPRAPPRGRPVRRAAPAPTRTRSPAPRARGCGSGGRDRSRPATAAASRCARRAPPAPPPTRAVHHAAIDERREARVVRHRARRRQQEGLDPHDAPGSRALTQPPLRGGVKP